MKAPKPSCPKCGTNGRVVLVTATRWWHCKACNRSFDKRLVHATQAPTRRPT